MKTNRRCSLGLVLLLIAGIPVLFGQDRVRISRSLESSTLEVWQSAQSRFQQLATGNRLSDADLDLYFDLNAFSKSATLLRELASMNNVRDLNGGIQSMLRQAVEIENLFDRSAGFARQFESWRNVQTSLVTLAQTANLPYAPLGEISQATQATNTQGTRDRTGSVSGTGRLWWRGVVDGSDRIVLRGNQVSIEHIDAQKIRDATHDLSGPLPRRSAVAVNLRTIRGRGRVAILEQPTSSNRYSVVVLIEDPKSGTDTYEFELTWQ